MKRITLTTLCLFVAFRLLATHVASAEVRYDYTGYMNTYNVYVTLIGACEPGAVGLPGQASVVFSSSCATMVRHAPLISLDTLMTYCTPGTGACYQPNSPQPQYVRRVYMDTISLMPCAWTISWSLCCRNSSIVNLDNPGGQELYVEAYLDNSQVHNSSAFIANPPHVIIGSGVPNSISVQAVDAQYDSIVYEWYQPQTANQQAIPYATGYSFADPLGIGGSAQLNLNNQTIDLLAPVSGNYNLALRVKDYRNGQLVGITARDFQVTAIGNNPFTAPLPSAVSSMQVTTCPGQPNSIQLTFVDNPADSVYLTVTTPNIPGFNFVQNINPGLGSATADISWITPLSADPATMPFFYINIDARDNNCPAGNFGMYSVAVLLRQCITDSVWAGDANGDWTVNVYDPLAVAVAYGSTGAPRAGATTNWQAEWCAPWADTFVNGVNYHHADCNGDGTVDALDLGAISSNWGSFHLKEGSRSKTTSVPDLWFDISNIGFHPGATVAVPVKLGTTAFPMNGFYGLATEVTVSGVALTNPVDITHGNTWVGPSASTLQFKRVNPSDNGQVSLAYARKDQQPVSGEGVIGYLEFDIPVTAVVGQQLHLSFSNTRIIDEHMNELTSFNVIDTSVLITPLSVNTVSGRQVHAAVVPNPSNGQAHLEVFLQQAQRLEMTIVNLHGQLIHRSTFQAASGHNTFALPEDVVPGIYLLNLTDNDQFRQSLKWIRQ